MCSVVVPKTQDENDSVLERIAHDLEASALLEGVFVTKECLLVVAELVGDGCVGFEIREFSCRVRDDLAVLDVQADNVDERAIGGIVGGIPLSNDSEGFGGINSKATAEEILNTHAIGVEVTSIFVAHTAISVRSITACGTITTGLTYDSAYVRSVGRSHGVRFPHVHFVATRSIFSSSSVGISGVGLPIENIGLSVNELDIVGALGIAVSSTVGSSGLVSRILGHTTISVHLYEVKGTVEATWKLAHVDIE